MIGLFVLASLLTSLCLCFFSHEHELETVRQMSDSRPLQQLDRASKEGEKNAENTCGPQTHIYCWFLTFEEKNV